MANIKDVPLDVALTPMVRQLHKRLSLAQVKDFVLSEEMEFHTNSKYLYLDVRHVIHVSGVAASAKNVMEYWPEMEKRIRAALLIRDPSVKARKVERRLMLARGEQARKSKARKS